MKVAATCELCGNAPTCPAAILYLSTDKASSTSISERQQQVRLGKRLLAYASRPKGEYGGTETIKAHIYDNKADNLNMIIRLVFMYKIKNGEYLANISNIFNVANNPAYILRSNSTGYAFNKPKSNFLKKGISYSVAKTWNDLPRSLKDSNISLGQFRAVL